MPVALPPAYQAALQQAEQIAFHHVLDEALSPDWQYKATKRNVTVHAQPTPGSVISRGMCTVSHPSITPERICALSGHFSPVRMEYDQTLTCDPAPLAFYSPTCHVSHAYAAKWPATTRDFVALFQSKPIPSHEPQHQGRTGWYTIAVGVDHSSAPPDSSRYVRATLNWYLTYAYITEVGGPVHIIHASNVKTNGLLPPFITNYFALNAPLEIANWCQYLQAGKGDKIETLQAVAAVSLDKVELFGKHDAFNELQEDLEYAAM